jgi:hypothetical protein
VEPYSPERQALDLELMERDRAARGVMPRFDDPKAEFLRRLDEITERREKAAEMGLGRDGVS